ncbi:cytochrome P450 [Fusarium solani]|uniref:Cytochrome P450 n=1 Tax=Fusarium solani TaxID=169388 RepID=A0A9P9GIL5_FUSSL|nr:cytochrome P450 [Fusarium solani]KAH7239791.1 cytochrome P450 [Fusarium solani]
MTLLIDLLGSFKSYFVVFLFGVLLHIAFFCRGEWDIYTNKIVVAWLGTLAVSTFLIAESAEYENDSHWQAFTIALKHCSTLATGTICSILTYRAAFHRLNVFPGPFKARLSNLYVTALGLKKRHLYKEVQELHRIYGDVVRIGPSEISINSSEALHALHSNNTPCVKGPWYNIIYPMVSLLADRNKKSHTERRKTWDKAFNAKALRDYETRVVQYAELLLHQLEKMEGQPFNAKLWIHYYTFDIMGDLAFGQSFGMLRDGLKHYYMKLGDENMSLIGAFSRLIWLFPLFKATPGVNHTHLKFQGWLREQVDRRRKNEPPVSDVFSWILEDYESKEQPTKQDFLNLHGDAHLIVVAGSDTTAVTITSLFYELSQRLDICSQLQEEIDEYKKEHKKSDYASLSHLKLLQACIDETLRLHPVVPSGLQRMTPPEGLQIGDTFVPGDTIVQVPSYTLQRDERVFLRPNEFLPERWTSQPDLVKDASAFAPFSMGRNSCVGKQLGLMEIRYVTTEILSRYNIQFAPGNDPKTYLENKMDVFTAAVPDLNLVFTPRN